MPDVVNDQEIGATAAEFVLGTLDSDERAGANELLSSNGQFRDLVRIWERRLGELHLMVEPVEPPAPIWDRIKGKIVGVAATPEAKPSEPPLETPPPAEPELTLDALEAELRRAGIGGADAAASPPPEAVASEPATAERVTAEPVTPIPVTPAEAGPVPVDGSGPELKLPEEPHDPRSLRRWRLAAILTTLIAAALAGLIAAWRYVPERLPPQLQAANVLNVRPPAPAPPPAPVRPSAPAESRFDE
jgi:hypothetical protein